MHGLGVVEDGSWWMEERKANVRRGFVTRVERRRTDAGLVWSGLVWPGSCELGTGSSLRGTWPTQKAGKRYKIYPWRTQVAVVTGWLARRVWAGRTCAAYWLSCHCVAGLAGLASHSLSPLTGRRRAVLVRQRANRAACETTLQRAPAAILLPLAPEESGKRSPACVPGPSYLRTLFQGCCQAPPGISLASAAAPREPGWPA